MTHTAISYHKAPRLAKDVYKRQEEAVALFQEENGLSGGGDATRETLQRLYASNARHRASYIYLAKGDTGYRVRELNERLKALYYLEGTPGSTYNNATVAAVKRLQAELGLRQTGTATASLQDRLFSCLLYTSRCV